MSGFVPSCLSISFVSVENSLFAWRIFRAGRSPSCRRYRLPRIPAGICGNKTSAAAIRFARGGRCGTTGRRGGDQFAYRRFAWRSKKLSHCQGHSHCHSHCHNHQLSHCHCQRQRHSQSHRHQLSHCHSHRHRQGQSQSHCHGHQLSHCHCHRQGHCHGHCQRQCQRQRHQLSLCQGHCQRHSQCQRQGQG